MILPRSDGVMLAHGEDSNARRAALTAASTSPSSPSATRAITSPVAGFVTSKVLPEAAATHLPLISSFFGVARNCVTGLDVRISLRTAFMSCLLIIDLLIEGYRRALRALIATAYAGHH